MIQLQEIDAGLSQLRKEIAMIPERIEASRKSLDMAKASLARSRSDLEICQKRKREKETDLEIQEGQLSKARDRQAGIKTNKEYQAHLQEIETLVLEKGRVEDELLELMEGLESFKKEEETQIAAGRKAEQEFESVKQDLEAQMKGFQNRLELSEKEREAVASRLEPQYLNTYQNIKKACRDLAVVPIQGGTCGGCHMNVPPQRVAEVKTQELILTCSQCQRILFWPTTTESPAAVSGADTP